MISSYQDKQTFDQKHPIVSTVLIATLGVVFFCCLAELIMMAFT